MLSTFATWATNLVLSMITEELIQSLFLSAAKSVSAHSNNKWDDKLVKVLEEHFDD
jgi:hypothetical protein